MTGRGKIDVYLRNYSRKRIPLPKWTDVREIAAANNIPALLAAKSTGHEGGKGKATTGKRKYASLKELLDKVDLTQLGECSQNEQKEAWELITEYASTFAVSNMNLVKTSLVKYSLKLMDNTPFKEHYWQIPPSMYEEV